MNFQVFRYFLSPNLIRNYWHSTIRPAGEAGSFVRGHEDLTLKQWAAFAVRYDACPRAADYEGHRWSFLV